MKNTGTRKTKVLVTGASGLLGAAATEKFLSAGWEVIGVSMAEQFRLVFVLPDYSRDQYESFGSSLDRFHHESEYRLPRPARYVVDRGGIAADLNADYRVRSEPSQTVKRLRKLSLD